MGVTIGGEVVLIGADDGHVRIYNAASGALLWQDQTRRSFDTVNKVPYLGNIPGLGVLFRSKQKTDNKDELLIFVTPKILREGADIY